MNTAIDTPADELSPDEQHAAKQAQAAMLHANKSPLDQSFGRRNERPNTARAPSLWDAEPVAVPSMSLDPGQIKAHEHFEELGGWNTDQATAAMQALQTVAKQIIEARETLRANPIKHEAELILELDDLANRLLPTATKKADAALKALGSAIASHEAALAANVKDTPHGVEIRQYVRTLKPAERASVLRQAIERGDATTVGALLGSPAPYLTGLDLSDEMHAAYLNQWNSKREPVKAKQIALMRHAQAKLEQAGSTFIASTEALTGVKHTTVAKLRQQRQKFRTVVGAALPSA